MKLSTFGLPVKARASRSANRRLGAGCGETDLLGAGHEALTSSPHRSPLVASPVRPAWHLLCTAATTSDGVAEQERAVAAE